MATGQPTDTPMRGIYANVEKVVGLMLKSGAAVVTVSKPLFTANENCIMHCFIIVEKTANDFKYR